MTTSDAAGTLPAAAVAPAARAGFMQHSTERGEPRDPPGRPNADEDSTEHRNRRRESQSKNIEPGFLETGNVTAG